MPRPRPSSPMAPRVAEGVVAVAAAEVARSPAWPLILRFGPESI